MTNVLIVEDSSIIQKLLKDTLSKDASIKVVGVASNGEDGVAQALALKPDIVLMDYRMPKMSAPEAIKKIMSTQPTPIYVITSAEPAEVKKKEVMGLGAVGFMAKPKDMDYKTLAINIITNVKVLSRLKPAKRTY